MAIPLNLFITESGNLLRRRGFADAYSAKVKLPLKRGTTYAVKVYFVADRNNNTSTRLATGSEVSVLLKALGGFEDVAPLASATTTARPAADTDPYTMTLLVDSQGLDEAFFVDGIEDNDVPSVDCEFEVAWTSDSWATQSATNSRIIAEVVNNLRQG